MYMCECVNVCVTVDTVDVFVSECVYMCKSMCEHVLLYGCVCVYVCVCTCENMYGCLGVYHRHF